MVSFYIQSLDEGNRRKPSQKPISHLGRTLTYYQSNLIIPSSHGLMAEGKLNE